MHRVDVDLEPLPDREVLRGAAQDAGVVVRVDQAGQQDGLAERLLLRLRVRRAQRRRVADRGDRVAVDEHAGVLEHPPRRGVGDGEIGGQQGAHRAVTGPSGAGRDDAAAWVHGTTRRVSGSVPVRRREAHTGPGGGMADALA